MNTKVDYDNKYGTLRQNYFINRHLLEDSENERHRVKAVTAVNEAIRNILLTTQHEDGQYIQKDKGSKAWLKINKNGRFNKFFNVEFKFHFNFYLDVAVDRANEYGVCVADPEFHVVSSSHDHVVYKVVVYYATQYGPKEFVNHVAFNYTRAWDIDTIHSRYKIKPTSYVGHIHNRIDVIDSKIAKLLKARDEYVDKLGPYFDGI